MALSHEAEAVFPQPRNRVYEAVVQAVEGLPKMKAREGDPVRGRLEVSKTVSWKSWGEKITVDLSEPNPGQTRMKVRSRLRAQLVDWGANRQNVDAIIDATTQRLGASGGAATSAEG